jgi:hypothetical protein
MRKYNERLWRTDAVATRFLFSGGTLFLRGLTGSRCLSAAECADVVELDLPMAMCCAHWPSCVSLPDRSYVLYDVNM